QRPEACLAGADHPRHGRRLRHGGDHAPGGGLQALRVALAAPLHGSRGRWAVARQNAQAGQTAGPKPRGRAIESIADGRGRADCLTYLPSCGLRHLNGSLVEQKVGARATVLRPDNYSSPAINTCFAAASSFNFPLLTFGYWRSSASNVSMTAAATAM